MINIQTLVMDDIPLFLILFSILGAAFAGIGIYIMFKNNRITKEGTRTRAKIVDFEAEVSSDSDGYETTYYYPILEFIDRGGNKVNQKMDVGATYKIKAKTIEIFYLLEEGEYNIVINRFFYRHALPWGFFVVGSSVVLFAILRYLGFNPFT